ncbi:hypothetical protein ACFYST_30990 [Kitasatospora sp. NPDC004614]|uniref:hypothetical protein n=1 Tax=unclassified Kitasatospora TaxID=2633591 RepID=UPI0036AF6747
MRSWLGGLFAAGGVLAVAAAWWGTWEGRSGGRMAVAELLGRPVTLCLTAVALFLAAVAVLGRSGGRWPVTLLWVGMLGALACAPALFHGGPDHRVTKREAAPDGADRALRVLRLGELGMEAESQGWFVQVENGSGWSARRWTVFSEVGKWQGEGVLEAASWDGPDRIVVTTDADVRVYDISGGAPVLLSTTPA